MRVNRDPKTGGLSIYISENDMNQMGSHTFMSLQVLLDFAGDDIDITKEVTNVQEDC